MTRPQDKTILVVDDEPDVRLYLQTVLEDAGFNVLTAGDGEEALEVLKENEIDFITLDLVMPKKSGIRLFHELKKNKQWSRIPIIVVTGHARDEEGKKHLDEILADKTFSAKRMYLEKPVKAQDLVDYIMDELGIDSKQRKEKTEQNEEEKLRRELAESLNKASTDKLRRILDLLKGDD